MTQCQMLIKAKRKSISIYFILPAGPLLLFRYYGSVCVYCKIHVSDITINKYLWLQPCKGYKQEKNSTDYLQTWRDIQCIITKCWMIIMPSTSSRKDEPRVRTCGKHSCFYCFQVYSWPRKSTVILQDLNSSIFNLYGRCIKIKCQW